jgi:MFS family permease
VVVPVALMSNFFTGPGQTYSFSIFINSYIDELGWSRTLVSSLYSTATLASGLLMFLMGRLVDRIGAKWMCLASGALLGVACLVNSMVMVPGVLFLGFFLARFAGQGTLGLATGTIAPHWFRKRRAMAIMIVGMGNSLAAMIFPLLNTYLVEQFGWRPAFRYLALGLWVLYLPLALIFLVSRPEDIGLHPDGQTKEDSALADTVEDEEVSFTQGQALKTPAFWLVAFASFQFSMVATGIAFHYISILAERGFSSPLAARVMSLSPLAGIVSILTVGLVLDRIKRPHIVLAAACLFQAVAYVLLAVIRTPAQAYLRSIISGGSSAVLMLSIGVLRPFLFGRRYIGGVSGMMAVVSVVGSALGPVVFGVVFDSVGGYTGILILSAVLPTIAAVGSLFVARPVAPALSAAPS